MSDGKLYKYNATTWSKSQSKKMSATAITDGKVRHANATTWYDNYPMEQYYTKQFYVKWTQGYQGDGVALYNGTFWGHDLVTGDSMNFRSLIGFDKTDMTNFIGGGVVTGCRLLINLKETSTNGNPDVNFGKHDFNSEPSSYNGYTSTDWGYKTVKQFPNKAYGGYWFDLNKQLGSWSGRGIGGIAMSGVTATAEDMARFYGYDTYASKLELTVLK